MKQVISLGDHNRMGREVIARHIYAETRLMSSIPGQLGEEFGSSSLIAALTSYI